jgi:hypothetical protein
MAVQRELYDWVGKAEADGHSPEDILDAMQHSKVDPKTGAWAAAQIEGGVPAAEALKLFKGAEVVEPRKFGIFPQVGYQGQDEFLPTGPDPDQMPPEGALVQPSPPPAPATDYIAGLKQAPAWLANQQAQQFDPRQVAIPARGFARAVTSTAPAMVNATLRQAVDAATPSRTETDVEGESVVYEPAKGETTFFKNLSDRLGVGIDVWQNLGKPLQLRQNAGPWEKRLDAAGESLGLVAVVLPFGPVGGPVALGAGTGALKYDELLKQGVPKDRAMKAAIIVNAAETIPELFSFRLGFSKQLPFIKKAVYSQVYALLGESTTASSDLAVDLWAMNPGATREQIAKGFSENIGETLKETAIQTAMQGGPQTAMMHGLVKADAVLQDKTPVIKNKAEEYLTRLKNATIDRRKAAKRPTGVDQGFVRAEGTGGDVRPSVHPDWFEGIDYKENPKAAKYADVMEKEQVEYDIDRERSIERERAAEEVKGREEAANIKTASTLKPGDTYYDKGRENPFLTVTDTSGKDWIRLKDEEGKEFEYHRKSIDARFVGLRRGNEYRTVPLNKQADKDALEYAYQKIREGSPGERGPIDWESNDPEERGKPAWFSRSTYPDWFKGMARNDVLPLLDKAREGRAMTKSQAEIVEYILESGRQELAAEYAKSEYSYSTSELQEGDEIVKLDDKGEPDTYKVLWNDGERVRIKDGTAETHPVGPEQNIPILDIKKATPAQSAEPDPWDAGYEEWYIKKYGRKPELDEPTGEAAAEPAAPDTLALTPPEAPQKKAKPSQPGLPLGQVRGEDLRAPEREGKAAAMEDTPLGKAAKEARDRDKQGGFIFDKIKQAYRRSSLSGEGGSVGEKSVAAPFYSKVEAAVKKFLPDNASPQAVRDLMKNQKVKADDLVHSGVEEFLAENAGKRISKPDLLAYIGEKQAQIVPVEFREGKAPPEGKTLPDSFTIMGRDEDGNDSEIRGTLEIIDDGKLQWRFDNGDTSELTFDSADEAREWAEASYRIGWDFDSQWSDEDYKLESGDTKFSSWKIPGESIPGSYVEHFETVPGENKAEWEDGHSPYSEVKNPIVRWRGDGRMADGKKTFLIHEIQAPNPENQAKMPDWARKRWREIGMKSAIDYAVKNGYDSVSLASGEQVAGLYDLSKQLSRVSYQHLNNRGGEVGILKGYDSAGKEVISEEGIALEKLPDYIGKEAANKIIQKNDALDFFTEGASPVEISGLDLKVGGEGIKKLYDRDLPGIMNDLGKKWGAKVGTARIKGDTKTPFYDIASLDITPSMKSSVVYEGQELYAFPGNLTPENLHKSIERIVDQVKKVTDDLLIKANRKPIAGVREELVKDANVANEWVNTRSYVAWKYPEFRPFFNAMRQQSIDRDVVISESYKLAEPYFNLEDKSRVDRALDLGDRKKEVFSDDQLDQLRLNDKEKAAYRGMRDMYDQALDRLKGFWINELGADPASVEEKFQGLEGYIPRSRFGKHFVAVRGDKNTLLDFRAFESYSDAVAFANKTAKAEPALDVKIIEGAKNDDNYIFEGADPTTLQLLSEIAAIDPSISDPFIDKVEEYFKGKGFRKHFIEREDTPGWSTDWTRVHSDYIVGHAKYLSKLSATRAGKEAMKQIDKKQKRLLAMAERDLKYMQNPGPESQGLRKAMFLYHIAGRLSSPVLNLTQTMTTTAPYLAQYVSDREAAQLVAGAAKDVVSGLKMMDPGDGKKRLMFDHSTLEPDLAAALRAAEQEGNVSEQLIYDLMGAARGEKLITERARVERALLYMYATSEVFNRRVAFISAWRAGEKRQASGKPLSRLERKESEPGEFESLKDFAEQAVNDTQFEYGRYNRPQIARGRLGAAAFQFKMYPLSYVEMLSKMAQSHGENINKGAFIKALGILTVLAGAGGLPGADDAKKLYEDITGESVDLTVRDWAAARFGDPKFGEVFLRGITRLGPVDMSRAIGLGDLLPDEPYKVFGPVGSVLQLSGKAYDWAKKGETLRALETMSPGMTRGAVRAARVHQEGLRGKRFEKLDEGAGRWPKSVNVGISALSFQPSDWTRVSERERAQSMIGGSAKGAKDTFLYRWAKARANGDDAEVERVKVEIDEYNKDKEKSERVFISPAALLRRMSEIRGEEDVAGKRRAPMQGRQEYDRIREQFR